MKNVQLIKSSPLLGEEVPPKENGEAGNYIHRLLEKLYPQFTYNPGARVDCPQFLIEIKTRDLDAISPITIGGMSIDSILTTEYCDSLFREKTQNIRFVKHQNGVIVKDYIINSHKTFVQQKIEDIYNLLREQLQNGEYPVFFSMPDSYFQWEKKKNLYSLRIKGNKLLQFEQASQTTIDKHFEFTYQS
jgi:hypothetical protein